MSNTEFDPAKSAENFRKHGIALSEAESVLYDDFAQTIEDPDSVNEHRFITLGMDDQGRLLVVCFTNRNENTRLISARKASPAETRAYDAKRLRLQRR